MADARFSPMLDRLLVGLFLLAIWAPPIGTIAGADPEPGEEENRELAPPPAPPDDLASLRAWPDAFTKYFTDHFAFRSRLVRWQAQVRVHLLGSSPTPDVLLGKDGWLFYATDGSIEDYSGVSPFTAGELRAWSDTLQHTQDWLARQGIVYAFVLAPDKHWIYPDEMPEGVVRVATSSRIDQLLDHLARHSTVRVLDVREPLRRSRPGSRVYHRTDTHWNDLGAFVAYREVMGAIGPALGIRPRTRDELELRVIPRTGLDLARMVGLGRIWVEEDLQLEPRGGRRSRVVEPPRASRGLMEPRVVTEGPADGPRAVVFRDSFGSAMIPFLSEHFSRAVYVWQNDVDPSIVAAERPAVVIQEWVGRHLYNVAPYDAVAEGQAGHQQ